MTNKKNNQGFSLIELLVVIAIFITVLLIITDIFMSVTQSQRRVIAWQKAQSELRYDLEIMAQEIRTGTINYNEYSSPVNVPEDELKLLKDKLSESDLEDSLKLIQGMTDESLQELKLDINEFLGDEEKEKEVVEDTNPFAALFSFVKKPEKKEKKEEDKEKQAFEKMKKKGVKPDSYPEEYIRAYAEAGAINNCYVVFDIYKKAHNMASFPYVVKAETQPPQTKAEEVFGFGKPTSHTTMVK